MHPEDPAVEQANPLASKPPDQGSAESTGDSYELQVSPDRLRAYVRVQGDTEISITVEDIKKFLKEKGIRRGQVADQIILEYIRLGKIQNEPCLIAEGTPSEAGKDAQVIYHFETDPLRIGKIKDGGAINFKDKGDIPQVKQGALLAEKVPLVKEKKGIDVFGNPIPVEEAKDTLIFCGTGTKSSPDGLKIYAQRDGRPTFEADGRFCVLSELRIEGDVGLETGNIRFDGFVNVGGAIQEGYQVRAGRLSVKEIYRAEVEVDGDVTVDGGIIGAKIFCRGNVTAKYIHSSQISAWKDVVVEKEVMDSQIETNGALLGWPDGKIFASLIIAKNGLAANQVGSETSKPCTIRIGVNSIAKAMLQKLGEEISFRQEEKEGMKVSLEDLIQRSWRVKEGMMKWVQIQDQATREKRAQEKLIAELRGKNKPGELALAEQELERLKEEIKSSDEPLQKLMDQEDQFSEKISALQLQIQEAESIIQGLRQRIEKDIEDGGAKETPSVKVLKQIYDGTILEGQHASLILKTSLENVLIKEVRITRKTPGGDEISQWNIKLSPLS